MREREKLCDQEMFDVVVERRREGEEEQKKKRLPEFLTLQINTETYFRYDKTRRRKSSDLTMKSFFVQSCRNWRFAEKTFFRRLECREFVGGFFQLPNPQLPEEIK